MWEAREEHVAGEAAQLMSAKKQKIRQNEEGACDKIIHVLGT
jgi:hypothetical protein